MKVRVDHAAAFLLLHTEGAETPADQDYVGWNCDGVEQALGILRENIACLEAREWTSAIIVPNKTVDEVEFG